MLSCLTSVSVLSCLVFAARQIGSEGAGLVAVYIATALLSEILTNNASGAIM